MLKVIDIKPKDTATLERIIDYLKNAKCFMAISIKDDGMPQQHLYNITAEQRIYLCEVAKHSAIEDFTGV